LTQSGQTIESYWHALGRFIDNSVVADLFWTTLYTSLQSLHCAAKMCYGAWQ